MTHNEIDTDFTAFAVEQDAQALGRVFDAASPELYRFALHLCGAPATAEDAVQATWLAAIEGSSRHDPARPVMPWLTGILHNKIRAHRRREALRSRPLDRDAPQSSDPAIEAERTELAAALDAGIEQLSEVYGPVVKLHLRHGLNANAIAETLGRPAGTVRTQLVRGLDKLRGLLPASLAGVATALALPSRGLAAVRSEVMSTATSASMAPGVATTSNWLARGLIVACATVVIGGLTWAALPSAPDNAPPAITAATPQSQTAPRPAANRPPADRSEISERSPAQTAAMVAARPAAEVLVSGKVVTFGSDIGLREMTVLAFSEVPTQTLDGWDASPIARTRTDKDGRFTVSIPAGRFALHALGKQVAMSEGVGGSTADHDQISGITIQMRPRVATTFTLLDPFGRPLPAHTIELSHSLGESAATRLRYRSVMRQGAGKVDVVTDRQGQAVITLPKDTNFYCTVKSDRFLRHRAHIDLKGKNRCVLRLKEGDLITGSVFLHDGRPAASARIRLSSAAGRTVVTDARGDFVLRGLKIDPESNNYLSVRHPEAAAHCVQPIAIGMSPLSIQLDPPRTIQGRVVDAKGQPMANAVVGIVGDRRIETDAKHLGQVTTWEWASGRQETRCDDEGFFELGGLYDGIFELTAAPEHLDQGAVRLRVRSGDTESMKIVITEDDLRGRVLSGTITSKLSGNPLPGAKVKIYPTAGGRARHAIADAKGIFEFNGCGETPFQVQITAPGHADFDTIAHAQTPAAPIEVSMLQTASLKLKLLAADGAPVPNAQVSLNTSKGTRWMFELGEGRTSALRTDKEGRVDLGTLPADRVAVTIRPRQEDPVTHTIDLRHGEDTEQSITLDAVLPPVFFQIMVARHADGARADGHLIDRKWDKQLFAQAITERALVDPNATIMATLSLIDGKLPLCTSAAVIEEPSEPAKARSQQLPSSMRMNSYAISMSFPGGGTRIPAIQMPTPTLTLRGRQTTMRLEVSARGYVTRTITIDGAQMAGGQNGSNTLFVLLTPK